MKRADFELQILPRLPPAARKEALRQLGAAPPAEEPKKKSARQKSVLVKAPVFCSRCGSYEHDKSRCGHVRTRIVSVEFTATKRTEIREPYPFDEGYSVFAVPVRTTNEQNGAHGFWATKAKKRDLVKDALREGWKAAGISLRARYRVTVTRISSTACDAQNLDSFLKSPIDQIALCMGVNDGGPLIEWVRRQEIGKNFAVRVELEELP